MGSNDSAGQHYNLKWTNHTNNILQMFSEQLHCENLVDVTLSCEGQYIKAHRMVLSACSPYFQELFKTHEVPHPLVIVSGVKYATLQQMIDFMYEGEIKVGNEDLDNLLTTAENLQIKGLCKIRREKNASEKTDPPKDQNETKPASVAASVPKGRKRRKQSSSPVASTAADNLFASNSKEVHNLSHIHNVNNGVEDCNLQKPEPKMPKMSPNKNAQEIKDKIVDKYGSKIPRPPNAFMVFANEWRKKLAVEHQGESNKEISVRLGNMWKSLPATTKEMYYTAARKADQDHKVKYPGYYYSPKEARLRKEMRGNSSQRTATGTVKEVDTASLLSVVTPEAKNGNSSGDESHSDLKDDEDYNYEVFDLNENNESSSSEEQSPSTSKASRSNI